MFFFPVFAIAGTAVCRNTIGELQVGQNVKLNYIECSYFTSSWLIETLRKINLVQSES